MTRSPKAPSCRLDNKILTEWLLKIGPSRQIVLKKLKQTLLNLGLPRPTVRKGLLQLVSHPIVQLNRRPAPQIKRKNRMRGPKSKRRARSCSKDKELPLDNNNNSNGCVSQEYSPLTSASCSWDEDRSGGRLDNTIASVDSPGKVFAKLKRRRKRKVTSQERHSRKLDPGEERNGIKWTLTLIEMTDPSSNNGSGIKKKQRERKIKKDRLLAKFKEIFGDDEELEQITSTVEATSEEMETCARDPQSTIRKSPVFLRKRRKRRHDHDRFESIQTKSKPPKGYASDTTVVDEISSGSTSDDAATIVEERTVAHLPGRVSINVRVSQFIDSSSDTVEAKSDTSATTLPNANKGMSDSSSDSDQQRRGTRSIPESGPETLTGNQGTLGIESSRVFADETPSASLITSQVASQVIPGLGIETDHKAPSPQEAETINSELLDKNFPKVPTPSHTPVCLKHERVDPSSDELEKLQPRVPKQEDPSSTTDTLPPADDPCSTNRLLGALDKIFIALHCRRRVDERQKTANKLAIKRNRQDELFEAHRELKVKMFAFKQELLYLYSKLETRNKVLKFICKGLKDRTSPDIQPFRESEIEAAMTETDLKIGFNKIEHKVESPEPDTGGGIICEIDLTQDDEMIDLCDSSTDPPKRSIKNETYQFEVSSDDGAEDVLVLDDLPTPSIAEVQSISPQQFETIEGTIEREKVVSPILEDICPCFVCSEPSSVSCGLCGKANYCSKPCQECDWAQGHHLTCVPSEAFREAVIRFIT